jgi:hypothetical protein
MPNLFFFQAKNYQTLKVLSALLRLTIAYMGQLPSFSFLDKAGRASLHAFRH